MLLLQIRLGVQARPVGCLDLLVCVTPKGLLLVWSLVGWARDRATSRGSLGAYSAISLRKRLIWYSSGTVWDGHEIEPHLEGHWAHTQPSVFGSA